MCYQLEKMMAEHADKLQDSDKKPLEDAIKKTREVAATDDAQEIKTAISELEQVSHAFSKTLYETTGAGADGDATAASADVGEPDAAVDDDAIDAEFEVKDS